MGPHKIEDLVGAAVALFVALPLMETVLSMVTGLL